MTRVRPSSVIELPLDSAYTICDGLLRMSHTLMLQLPEPQLREIRHLLNNISCRADQLLDTYENDISLDFTGLTLSPGQFHFLSLLPSPPTRFLRRPLHGSQPPTMDGRLRCCFGFNNYQHR